jgi:ABC-type Mn2+/Zn2+ transport system ATPase subunit
VLGILPLAGGRVEVFGRAPAQARDAFSYLPQRAALHLDLPLRARDVVMMGRLRPGKWLRPASKADKEAVREALARVGLNDRADSPIGEMSFGQQQRVFFARALAQDGRLVLLDEPMNGVDPQTQELFTDLLRSYHAAGRTIVMATHDLGMAASVCDRICVLNQRLVAYGTVAEIFSEDVLERAYGPHLHFPDAGAGPVVGHPGAFEDVHHHDDADEERRRRDRLA